MPLKAALAELKSKIGTETHISPWLEIDQERINTFAEATDDFQWIHTDSEKAKDESPYGTTIAHGFLTLSLIPYLSQSMESQDVAFPGMTMAINYGLNKVRFPNAVPVGSKVRGHVVLDSVEEVKGGLQLIEQVTVEIEGERKPACVAETVTLLYF